MRILAIETSCDETAIAILECTGDGQRAEFSILGNALLSQIDIHKEYGGVFPALAKREHAKNLMPILESALEEAELLREDAQAIPEETRANIVNVLAREPGLAETFFDFVDECEPPKIDAIAVTAGPGLEPALWVGINFAKALALAWAKPLVAVNHMEGHIMAALASERSDLGPDSQGLTLEIQNVAMPVLALLVSGGHTELVLMREWLSYELIGRTRDDAVGEAFDKVARMLALPYPGGPEISKLAEAFRAEQVGRDEARLPDLGLAETRPDLRLPRPMLDSLTCDFSFAGLKTAMRYLLRDNPNASEHLKKHIAHEFENAVTDVLWKKTAKALDATGAKTLVIGGGVSANTHIRRIFTEKMKSDYPDIKLCIPSAALATDNAVMVALAGFYRARRGEFTTDIVADGNLHLAQH